MRRIKVIVAAVAAMMVMAVLSAPAMAQDYDETNYYGNTTMNYDPDYYPPPNYDPDSYPPANYDPDYYPPVSYDNDSYPPPSYDND